VASDTQRQALINVTIRIGELDVEVVDRRSEGHADERAYTVSVSLKNNARLVYSTETAGKCPVCGWPQRDCQCSTRHAVDAPIPSRIVAKVRVEKKGRGGKTVTVVYGLPQNAEFLKELSQDLKRACGTGGTVVEGGVELQGDLRPRVRDVLTQRGYIVKG
jgi:translation initiation factor 1